VPQNCHFNQLGVPPNIFKDLKGAANRKRLKNTGLEQWFPTEVLLHTRVSSEKVLGVPSVRMIYCTFPHASIYKNKQVMVFQESKE
jgi:hypothetical protein